MPLVLTLENLHFSLAMATAEVESYMDYYDNIARSIEYTPHQKLDMLYDIEINIRRCLHDNYHTLDNNANNGEGVTQDSRGVALHSIRDRIMDDMEAKHASIITKIYQRVRRGIETARSRNTNGKLITKMYHYKQSFMNPKRRCDG